MHIWMGKLPKQNKTIGSRCKWIRISSEGEERKPVCVCDMSICSYRIKAFHTNTELGNTENERPLLVRRQIP